jgi:hypothetical protein
MPVRHTCKTIGDFAIHTLRNDAVSISMAPELGGRIVSLRDRVSGREWLDGWSPASKRRIWRPTDPDDFGTGPGAGLDECLPTVLACRIERKSLPDHGELWSHAPEFDPGLATEGVFSCRWNLKSLPLAFERRVSLEQHAARFEYRIVNRADEPTPFLWAWHPLFTWRRGDRIRFARSVKTCLSPAGEVFPWPETPPGSDLSQALFPKGATPAAKVFLGPLAKGRAEIRALNGACLALTWPSSQLPYAGVWITRGFWKGLHHWAIEPTIAPVDRLSDIPDAAPLARLAPREIREWTLLVSLAAGKP